MAQWNSNCVPKCEEKKHSEEVLVTIQITGYRGDIIKRVVKSVYFPFHNCTVEDMRWDMLDGVPDDWDYSEEDDSWWIPQGWYEVCDYFDDYSYASITDKVIAWMKMPKPFESRVEPFGLVKGEG